MTKKKKIEEFEQISVLTIRKQLQYGDRQIIARVVGCSSELVKKVLSGERNHRKGKGKRVVEVAVKVIETREFCKGLWFMGE